MRNEKGVLAWHFCTEGRKLGYGDEREIRVGETLTVEGPVMLCDHGLHGSVKLLNALSYAPGCTVERVRIGGEVVHGDGKLVGTERTCLGIGDVRKELVVFAEWCARRARRAAAGASASAGGAV